LGGFWWGVVKAALPSANSTIQQFTYSTIQRVTFQFFVGVAYQPVN
jgi:hypothetical protein